MTSERARLASQPSRPQRSGNPPQREATGLPCLGRTRAFHCHGRSQQREFPSNKPAPGVESAITGRRCRWSYRADVLRLGSLGPLDGIKLDFLILVQGTIAAGVDCAVMDENVPARSMAAADTVVRVPQCTGQQGPGARNPRPSGAAGVIIVRLSAVFRPRGFKSRTRLTFQWLAVSSPGPHRGTSRGFLPGTPSKQR